MARRRIIRDQENRNVLALGGGEIGEIRQDALYNARVMVVGSGPVSQMLMVNLAGLAIGKIYLVDNDRIKGTDTNEFLYRKETASENNIGRHKILEMAETVFKINSGVNVETLFSRMVHSLTYRMQPQIVIDTTNSQISKRDSLQYAQDKGIPYLSISSEDSCSRLSVYVPEKDRTAALLKKQSLEYLLHDEFTGKPQGHTTSGVVAGMAAHEVIKHLLRQYNNGSDLPLANGTSINYNTQSFKRNNPKNDIDATPLNYYRNKRILLIGAGALGNSAALFASLAGIGKIDIIDFDITKRHNLSRQVLLYDGVGKNKAEVLSERIKEISGCVSTPYTGIFERGNSALMRKIADKEYDIIFTCVDKLKPRFEASKISYEHGVAHVNGGTNPTAGSVTTYWPGHTHCIDCQESLERKAAMEKPSSSVTSCIEQPDPSIIMPNFVIGAVMIAEGFNILNNRKKMVLNGTFYYDANIPRRIFTTPPLISNSKQHGCYTNNSNL